MGNLKKKENNAENKSLLNIDKHSCYSFSVSPKALSSMSPEATTTYSKNVNPDPDLGINVTNMRAVFDSMSVSPPISSSSVSTVGSKDDSKEVEPEVTKMNSIITNVLKITTAFPTSLPAQSDESSKTSNSISTISTDACPPHFDSVVEVLGTRKAEVEPEAAEEVEKVAAVSSLESENNVGKIQFVP